MKLNLKRVVVLTIIAVTSFAFKSEIEQVKGWFLAGSSPESYEIGTVTDTERREKVVVNLAQLVGVKATIS
jgi:hypothetical protein